MKKSIIYIASLFMLLEAVELEPITVYSTKLQDNLLDNPNSIAVVDAQKMEQSKSKNIRDLSALISNTNISGIGSRNNVTITLRGINNYVATESSVAIYVDDVPISNKPKQITIK